MCAVLCLRVIYVVPWTCAFFLCLLWLLCYLYVWWIKHENRSNTSVWRSSTRRIRSGTGMWRRLPLEWWDRQRPRGGCSRPLSTSGSPFCRSTTPLSGTTRWEKGRGISYSSTGTQGDDERQRGFCIYEYTWVVFRCGRVGLLVFWCGMENVFDVSTSEHAFFIVVHLFVVLSYPVRWHLICRPWLIREYVLVFSVSQSVTI